MRAYLSAVCLLIGSAHRLVPQHSSAPFVVDEATIAEIHSAMRDGRVTARQLVDDYLARIGAYDKRGPRLNALITVSSDARHAADSLDALFARTRKLVGPLHGIPVIVKDNIDTRDMPTTAGSLALVGSRPPEDAFVVQRLREAGAIILAKSNLPDFASLTFETVGSALPGYTRNPYDLAVTTAGSSGGTASAIAASFGAVGLGTDTGNSIRGPAAFLSLVGLRPTVGLVSRHGVVPLDPARDVTGPMTRTVRDAARVLDVIAGNDPTDTMTARSRGHIPADGYEAHLEAGALRGARVGVLRQLSNTPTADAEVLRRFEQALVAMRTSGAIIVDPTDLADAATLAQRTPRECRPFRQALAQYLRSLGPGAPVHSLNEIVASGKVHPSLDERFRMYRDAPPPETNDACRASDQQVDQLRAEVQRLLSDEHLDALVYPSWNNPPRLLGDLNTPDGSNGPRIASVIGFPAITVPMGFVRDGTLPVGLEMLGAEWSEARILELAYAYETATHLRRAPIQTPPLAGRVRR
jgi:Asp-tRNA(Asn)/Glu-tRNA(Gln) amidotransferase A subunit family amidase